MFLVLSMLRAMLDHPVLSTRNATSLEPINLAANDVIGSDARACSEVLHAKLVMNCLDMTETSGTTQVFARKDGAFKDAEPLLVGRMRPDARSRICTPGSRRPLTRRIIEELHQGGRTVTDRYIGGSDEVFSFYTDGTVYGISPAIEL